MKYKKLLLKRQLTKVKKNYNSKKTHSKKYIVKHINLFEYKNASNYILNDSIKKICIFDNLCPLRCNNLRNH